MNSKKVVTLVFLVLSITIIVTTQAFAEESELDYSKLADKLDTAVQEKVEMYDVVGLSVGLVTGDGLIWSKGYGYEEREENKEATDETLYRIASVTKTFTATGIMILRDRGLLSLDDPIKKYLPSLKLNNTYNKAITIRNLLTHRSGIRRDLGRDFNSNKPMSSIIKKLKGDALLYKPGTKYSYSNIGYSLLGLIIENITGTSYEIFIHKEILSPLEMNNTYIGLNQKNIDIISRGYYSPEGLREEILNWFENFDRDYTKEEEELFPLLPIRDKAAGSIITSIKDASKYMSFFLRGGKNKEGEQILSEDCLEEMYSINHSGSITPFNSHIRLYMEDMIGIVVFTNTEIDEWGEQPAGLIAQDIAGKINLFKLGIDM